MHISYVNHHLGISVCESLSIRASLRNILIHGAFAAGMSDLMRPLVRHSTGSRAVGAQCERQRKGWCVPMGSRSKPVRKRHQRGQMLLSGSVISFSRSLTGWRQLSLFQSVRGGGALKPHKCSSCPRRSHPTTTTHATNGGPTSFWDLALVRPSVNIPWLFAYSTN